MTREKIYLSLIISLFITIGVTLSQVIFAAWTPPTSLAPGNNILAPLNQSSPLQQKEGPFHIGQSAHGQEYGLTVSNGMTWTEEGLQIEIRASDPPSPQLGRIWIRN